MSDYERLLKSYLIKAIKACDIAGFKFKVNSTSQLELIQNLELFRISIMLGLWETAFVKLYHNEDLIHLMPKVYYDICIIEMRNIIK